MKCSGAAEKRHKRKIDKCAMDFHHMNLCTFIIIRVSCEDTETELASASPSKYGTVRHVDLVYVYDVASYQR